MSRGFSWMTTFGLLAACALRAVAGPVMVIDHVEQDAGRVKRGEVAKFTFSVRNTGDSLLRLDAQPACGCTFVNAIQSLQAGQSGQIRAEMHTDAFSGPTVKLINVDSNDPKASHVVLRTLANVISPVEVLPTEYPRVALQAGQQGKLEMVVHFAAGEPGKLIAANCADKGVTTTIAPMPPAVDGGARYAVHVRIAASAPNGSNTLTLLLVTTSPSMREITVYATCEKGILVTPSAVYMGEVHPGADMPATQIVSVRKAAGSFHVRSASANDPHLAVKLETPDGADGYRITLRYKGGWPVGAVRRTLRILTDDPRQPVLTIPVNATVRKPESGL